MGHFPPVRLGSLRERIYLYISSYVGDSEAYGRYSRMVEVWEWVDRYMPPWGAGAQHTHNPPTINTVGRAVQGPCGL